MNQTSNSEHFLVSISPIGSFVYGIILSLLSILTLLGNSLVCLAIWRFRNLRNLTNYLVCSLACADLLVPLLRVIYVVISVFAGEWLFGETWCGISSMCGVLLCGASILHLCVITIERLVAIKWPLSYNIMVTRNRIVISLVYIWIQSIILALFPLLGLVKHRFNPVLAECALYWQDQATFAILITVFYFLVPVTIMLVAYAIIFKEVRRNSRRISAIHYGGPKNDSNRFTREKKAVKTLAVVVGVFFLMWMPYFVTTPLRAFQGDSSVPDAVLRIVITLAYGNSCCNFVIYSLMNSQLRNAFCRIMKRCCVQSRLQLDSTRAVELPTIGKTKRLENESETALQNRKSR